jgi:hypothetical protein
VVIAILIALYSLNLIGLFCGIVLGAILFGPLMFGMLLGWILRAALKQSRWQQRGYLPTLILLIALPLTLAFEARFPHNFPYETVNTTIVLPVSVDRAWDSLMFYEEIRGKPSWLMRVALPQPLYARGSTEHVGDIKVCVYTKGRLLKRVTQRVPDSLLAFDVIEQTHVENRWIILKTGSFHFRSVSSNQTAVTLSTTYQPLLAPRWEWRWAEALEAHALHAYVLRGMLDRAGRQSLGTPLTAGLLP